MLHVFNILISWYLIVKEILPNYFKLVFSGANLFFRTLITKGLVAVSYMVILFMNIPEVK